MACRPNSISRVVPVLEADDGVVRVAHDDHVAGRAAVTPAPDPQVVDVVQVDVRQERAARSTHNLAKLPFDPSVTIPREGLRPKYRDGFWGAPLAPCRPFGAGQPAGGGADGPQGDAPRGSGEP